MAAFGDFHLVNGAGWSVYWRIRELEGSGLEVWFADFHGRRVLWRGSQPFAIVPYHRPVLEPKGPEHTYKDGTARSAASGVHGPPALGAQQPGALEESRFQRRRGHRRRGRRRRAGLRLRAGPPGHLRPSSSAAGISTSIAGRSTATATSIRGSPWGSAQSVWQGEGARPPHVLPARSGSRRFPERRGRGFRARRLRGSGRRRVEADHQAGQASGRSVPSPQVAGPRRHEQERSGPAPRLPDRAATDGQPDKYSTGDLWVTVYLGRRHSTGRGRGVDCTDSVLETVYANGPLDTVNGNDVVLWAVRAHHEPRHEGESSTTCHITTKSSVTPRNFEVFREARRSRG